MLSALEDLCGGETFHDSESGFAGRACMGCAGSSSPGFGI